MSNYSHNIIKSVIDKNTGLIIDQTRYKSRQKTTGGWIKMYKKDYLMVQEDCVKSTIDLRLWNYIIDKVTSEFTIFINVSSLSKKIGCSRQKTHQFLKRALDNGFIRREQDGYEVNPFIVIPYGVNDDVSSSAQRKWKDIAK